MRIPLPITIIGLGLVTTCACAAQREAETVLQVPGADWEHVAPATQAFLPERLSKAIAFATSAGSTSGMIVHDGRILADWGDVSRKTNVHSVRKSFASALAGIAIERGQLRLDDTLAQLGIDDEPPALSADEKQATLRMLLEARSGIYHRAAYETGSMQARRPARHSHPPGTYWYYNNWDFDAIGAILEQRTGENVFDEIQADIANPIGMQDYRPSDGHDVWERSATRYPAYPFAMSARDLARFALLYLHRGRWGTRQVVPAAWVDEATRSYSDTSSGGYGYLWWTNVSASGAALPLRRPAYWAEGHLGQFAMVVPSLDLVVVSLDDPRLTNKPMSRTAMLKFLDAIEAAQGADARGDDVNESRRTDRQPSD
jgi:CubicO group peptidase (beta-lactamase class C family)